MIADSVTETKQSCERDLAEALPALENANRALEKIDNGAIAELKKMMKPPAMVQTVMCSVALLMGQKETWEEAIKMAGSQGFLKSLKAYGDTIDSVPEKFFLKFRKTYLLMEELSIANVVFL